MPRPTKFTGSAFGYAHSGQVFQEAQALDLKSVSMLHLFQVHFCSTLDKISSVKSIILIVDIIGMFDILCIKHIIMPQYTKLNISLFKETRMMISFATLRRCTALSTLQKILLAGEILTTQMCKPLNLPIRMHG